MRGDTLTGPVEPKPSGWTFPPAHSADENGLVGAGADLEAGTLLAAYSSGLFPMPLGDTLGWWSPDPRGVLPLSYLKVGRSLRRACKDFEIRVNHAFDQVIDACASPVRPHGWIDANIRDAYIELHRLGWAHSVEAWRDDELVGGLYGVAIGAFFAGESMFHSAPNASKVALVALVDAMKVTGGALIDIQWNTPHLESLGAVEIGREEYLELLGEAVDRPLAEVWARPMNFTLLDD
ncbi:MAG TPA: leucyl/phenylalanyl-tRNA--protein transferase [Acidimicrobiaceae bacterium]|nr:leucyl/phenylalanyl-tRNA--protein transferase [Acidimicrobiaceae bacterium]MAP97315.1 leucyl/phenylalanyl-tRNA--protein transferase [Acidimicrobiaceae bacterium]HAA66437.1 leucyl/phenylalanyl-tRNA--protein transferase [Acidimicrobiaceae bacterium]HAY66632.1 leucyl/phenylalanyl-tRNA--protein transferase [Acidimicrobiaceae bacterium]HBV24921.1 leucyl/phenylalanyl-tRNA--protein transferase [Acidimicrobiaceae bacterium]